MADTIGDLIDKLTISNIRIWHIEDAKRNETDLNKLASLVKKNSDVNIERNNLIDQINASIAVLVDHKANRISTLQISAKDLLGVGKNKFYVSQQELVDAYDPIKIKRELEKKNSTEYYGQWETDRIIADFFRNRPCSKTCIEIGAGDGIKGSNTYYFEKNLGWNCLCVEPNIKLFIQLDSVRKNSIHCACASKNGRSSFQIFVIGENEIETSLSSLEPDQRLIKDYKDAIQNEYTTTVLTCTLEKILEEQEVNHWPFGNPRHIDFISIDTEGTELDVLKGIDLANRKVSLLVVENNYNDKDIEEYLKDFNYVKIERYHVNDFFARKDFS